MGKEDKKETVIKEKTEQMAAPVQINMQYIKLKVSTRFLPSPIRNVQAFCP